MHKTLSTASDSIQMLKQEILERTETVNQLKQELDKETKKYNKAELCSQDKDRKLAEQTDQITNLREQQVVLLRQLNIANMQIQELKTEAQKQAQTLNETSNENQTLKDQIEQQPQERNETDNQTPQESTQEQPPVLGDQNKKPSLATSKNMFPEIQPLQGQTLSNEEEEEEEEASETQVLLAEIEQKDGEIQGLQQQIGEMTEEQFAAQTSIQDLENRIEILTAKLMKQKQKQRDEKTRTFQQQFHQNTKLNTQLTISPPEIFPRNES